MTPLFSLGGLKKSFGGSWNLSVENLVINAGDGIFLRGNNGSGKTTLLKILAGLLPPDELSSLEHNGKPRRHFPCGAPVSVYLHQTPYLFSTSVRCNVEYGLRRCHLPPTLAADALNWAGLSHLAANQADKLSGGEQSRCALARVAALSPSLVLLDEPSAHLDAQGVALAVDLVARLRADNCAVVLISHDKIDFPANRRWHLEDGRLSED